MAQKWNLQDIRPAEPRKRRAPQPPSRPRPETPTPERDSDGATRSERGREHIPSIVIENGTKSSRGRLVLSIVIFVVIIGAAVGLSAMTGKTELTIYPEYRQPNVSAEFTAYPEPREGELSYTIMTLEATDESQVKATGQVEVEELATGLVEIQKTTPGAQRLIKNTRFRNSAGLVFRIKESVVIPGSVTDENGQNVPGVTRAEVFADDVGQQYNLPAGETFTVPGFEEAGETKLFQAISATNPEPFTGGFKGPQFQIDEQELQTARQALQIKLRDNLLLRIATEKPADHIAFEDAVAITYNALPPVQYGTDLVTIREQAILQIPLFQSTAFGSFLAKETVATYEGGAVRVADESVLTFAYTNATTSASVIANEPSLTFRLTGKPLLIWEYDAKKLAENLAGLPKTALGNAVPAFPGIDEARVHMTPFWQRTFPEDPDEIIMIEELKDPQTE